MSTSRKTSTVFGLTDLPEEFSQQVRDHWDAFVHAAEAAGVEPPRDPALLSSLKRVWTFSEFVARSCIRRPSLLKDLLQTGDLHRTYLADEYVQLLKKAFVYVTDEAGLSSALRRFRQREMVRIAWRDAAGLTDLHGTMADLSFLAEACLQGALTKLNQWQCQELGMPLGEGGAPQSMVVVGMGKLGAGELNFSSDIDLIFAYEKTGETRGGPRTVTNEEYFLRLARRLISAIGSATSEGFVFRVDTRLRPYGENGPLVMSFDGMEAYYQREGREWERYAWIKARAVAGDLEAGSRLLKMLHPFVYRRYLDFGAFESLREMKRLIAQEVKRKGLESNVKLGPGGIREVEFIGQALQLIRGGRESDLQEQRILKILELLGKKGYLPESVCADLQAAYVFLRNTEHRLQEYADQRTQSLPRDPTGRAKLALSMGYPDWGTFEEELRRHMGRVHDHFRGLFAPSQAKVQTEPGGEDLHGVWLGVLGREHCSAVLAAAGFEDPDEVLRLLEHLRNAHNTRTLGPLGRRRLDRLVPMVLESVPTTDRPLATLRRVLTLIETIEQRTSYLALLAENPPALAHLIKLLAASPWIAAFVSRHPILLDELLDPRALYAPPERPALAKELSQRLARIEAEDLEQQMDELRSFKQTHVLRVAAADVAGALPLMKVSDHLTYIAEVVLNEVLELTWRHLVAKHGPPTCSLGGKACDKGFAVVSYGKLAGIELGYGSDLDLVFLHAGSLDQKTRGPKPVESAVFFTRLGQRVIHILTARTSAGVLYPVDMRLRPSGRAGVLVSHVEAFADYQLREAWTWEHQALLRARVVAGDPMVGARFDAVRREALSRPRRTSELRREVAAMRERMRTGLASRAREVFDLKQGRGGIVDIEFIVQFLVLLGANEHPELIKWTDNVRLLETISSTGLMRLHKTQFLKDAYLAYRAAVHRLNLQERSALVPDDVFRDLREGVRETWEDLLGGHAD